MRRVAYRLSLVFLLILPMENLLFLPGVGRLSKAVGLAVAATWLLAVLASGRFRRPRPFHAAVLGFVVWNVLSVFWTVDTAKTAERIETYLQLLGMVLVLWDLLISREEIAAALQAFVLGASGCVAGTIYNYFAGNAVQENYGRFSAAGMHVDDAGFILALGMPLAWYLAVHHERRGSLASSLLRLLNYGYLPSAAVALLLTGTRGAVVATVPVLLYMASSMMRARLAMRVLTVGALLWVMLAAQEFLPESTRRRFTSIPDEISEGDLNGRIQLWRQGFEVLAGRPLLGVGSGAYRTAVENRQAAHNVFVSVLVELGTIGCLLFLVILAIAFTLAAGQPRPFSMLWLSLLLVWTLGASSLTWEHRKQTWMVLALVVAGCPARVDSGRSLAPDRAPMPA